MARRGKKWKDTWTPPLFKPESAWRPPSMDSLPSWEGARRIGLDIETQDDDLKKYGPGVRRGGRIVGVSFAIEDGPKAYLPVGHAGGDNMDPDKVFRYLKDQSKTYKGSICGANLGYDLDYLAEKDITFWDNDLRDIQVAEPLLNENRLQYNMEALSEIHGLPGKDETRLREAAQAYYIDPKKHLWKLPARYVGEYAEHDALLPLQILRRQERLIDDQGLWGIYDLERQVQPILVKMRRHGVLIDFDHLERVEKWTIEQELIMLNEIFIRTNVRIALDEINKKTLTAAALDAAGLPYEWTSGGETGKPQPKINTELLMPPAKSGDKVASAIIHAKYLNKLRNTFVKSVRGHATNGRIHATLNQLKRQEENADNVMGAGPGRMSSSNPNCFSDDTEVLTTSGWKLFKYITHQDKLAQYRDGNITYAHPAHIVKFQYTGDMVTICGPKVDLKMTPDHRCLLLTQGKKEKTILACDYQKHLNSYQVHSGVRHTGTSRPAWSIQLAVAVQADAAVRKTTIRFFFKEERKASRLISLLQEGQIPYTKKYIKSHTPICIVFKKSPEILQYLTDTKEFSRKILDNDVHGREIFLNELSRWDGTRAKDCTKTHRYFTTSKKSADIVSEVAACTGWRISARHSNTWANNKSFFDISLYPTNMTKAQGFSVSNTPYSGMVYCATMPHGTVLVRRNGKFCVTGNCQQQPGRLPDWWQLDVPVHTFWRKIYLPDEGGLWAACDFSAQEPRMLVHFADLCESPGAHIARDKIIAGFDFHDITTELAFNMANPGKDAAKELQKKFKNLRGRAKIIFLGLVYGMGGGKLCRTLGFPVELIEIKGEMREVAGDEGKAFLKEFHGKVPFLSDIKERVENVAWSRRYIITLLGRHIHYELGFGNERKALNHLIQGSSADQTKKAMVEIYKAGYTLQLQVHDECDTTVYNEKTAYDIAEIMQHCVKLNVPSKVDVELGKSWGHSMEVKS